MQESHPTHMQSHDDYGIYMHINTTKSHHFMALLYGMTPWQITFHDFQMTWIHLHSLPLGIPSTRDESATSLVQWWNPTSSGRYPPSDDWHHPIQRLEPGKKKSKRLFFFHKNVKMFYTESLKTWGSPGWFHHGFQGSGLEVWLQHDFGSRLQVVGIHKIQILRFAILSLNFPRFPCWFPDSVGSPPHGSFEEHLVMNKMITQNRKSKNVWT